MNFEVIMMTIPCVTALYYGEVQGFAYLFVMILEGAIGYALTHKKPIKTKFYTKEGFVAVSLCWIVMSFFGAMPFVLNGEIPSLIDALFETVSGFTTTGASILSDVEGLCRTNLMWRSLTHWFGGMGILVFVLMILPLSGGSSMHLLRAESPGPSVGKLTPKIRTTAFVLYGIYFVMTIIQIVLLLAGGMPAFDAITVSFGTAGTGGFSIKNTGIQSYSIYSKWVVAVFMMLFGINFNVYYLMLHKKFKAALKCEEMRWYLLIIILATLFITLNILHRYKSHPSLAVLDSFFHVSSIITTTGFATTDFNLWPQQSKTILVLLMFIGSCAGSTGGGMKVSRIIMLIKTIPKELGYYLHPHSVRKITFEGKSIEHETVRSISVYLTVYFIIFACSQIILCFDQVDMVSSFTAVAATINNVGPGLELVGPYGNYGFFSAISKLVLIFDMLAGRLELIPILLLFSKETWKGMYGSARKKIRGSREV